jgi:hypothetical protein
MLNQVSVGLGAYAKSSRAETKLGTSTFPMIVTGPRKISSGAGEVIAIGGASWRHCAASRKKAESQRKRSCINRTFKFNMKRGGSQILMSAN